jgi:hypothetical protein
MKINPQKTLGVNYIAPKTYKEAYKILMNYISGIPEIASVFNQYKIWNIVKIKMPYICSIKQLLMEYVKVGLHKEIPIIIKANNDKKFDFFKRKIEKRKFLNIDDEREYIRKRMERQVIKSNYINYIK